MDDDEFVELLWDNEQPVMQQGQAKRVRNSSSPIAYPSSSDYGQFKGGDDDPVPWTNYQGSPREDYSPEFFTMSEPCRTISHPSQQYQSSVPNNGLGEAVHDLRSQRPVAPRSPSSSVVRNFSYDSGPPGHVRASVQSISGPRSGRSASGGISSNHVSSKVAKHEDPKGRGKKKVREQDLGKTAEQSTAEDVQNLSEIDVRAHRSPAADVQNIPEKYMSAKRTRAADVHNLSERRRRDRINEKIRSLQEMIPNCNKVDKASILDETIEYIKTLQLQLQMSTVQNPLLNPLMMSHIGMQLASMPTMPPLLPMGAGIGKGSGLNYGMGMYDTSSVHHFPFIPVPPLQKQFGPGLHGMQGSTGFPGLPNSGQGLAVPMPGPSLFPSLAQLPTNVTPVPDITVHRSLRDQQHQNIDIESTEKRSTK